MDDELRELRERISLLSNEELLRMVGKDRREYRPEAVEYARAELDARRAADEADEADDEADDGAEGADAAAGLSRRESPRVPAVEGQPCDTCGGAMRRGALFADREITVYFDDTEEERFLEALVCSACGTVRLVVDLDTDVQE
ncbi:MAG TPA: hypothetical protein VJZ91_00235 [Blastocatellia bacterium]|nr:hypothetical protein [Blastocatellia bacterium]